MVLLPRFYGCDAVTGEIIEELTDLVPNGQVSHILGSATAASFDLPLLSGQAGDTSWGAPPAGWKGATEPGRCMIVITTGAESGIEQPIWAGIIYERRGGSAPRASLACATFESYLERRFIDTHEFDDVDEVTIAEVLLEDANDVEGVEFEVDVTPSGTTRDRTYFTYDDKTVAEALQELMDIDEGIEWTIRPAWKDANHNSFSKVVFIADRIGVAAPAEGPSAVFEVQASSVFDVQAGADVRYQWFESYDKRYGANHIIAVSSGQGDIRPASDPARDEDLFAVGWPRYEERFTPSSSIIEVSTLNAHAVERLTKKGRGLRTLAVTARADVYPLLIHNWDSGDDIGYDLIGPYDPEGVKGTARCLGWELDLQRDLVSPFLVPILGEEE
jgi:hypothetical protein